MTAIAHVARACALENRDTLHVTAITGLTLVVTASVLLRFGSFAQLLAALGLAAG